MNRVVITGMGIWSCIGTSLDEVRDALYAGKSGIILDPVRKEAGFRSGLVGNVPKADLKALLPRNTRSYMHEESQYAYLATLQALQQAGIDMDYLEQHEVGIVYGNDSAVEASSKAVDKFHQMNTTVSELHHLHEPGLYLQTERYQPDDLCCLCLRFPEYWHGSHPYRQWSAGLHHLWRC